MQYVISRAGNLGFAIDVTCATQDRIAVAGVSYADSSGTATIPASQASVIFAAAAVLTGLAGPTCLPDFATMDTQSTLVGLFLREPIVRRGSQHR
jgi:hypothetical protein